MLSESGASTSAEQCQNDDVDVKAVKLIGEGKRHLLVGDAPTAVTALQEACEILAAKYGELSDQCGDPYYNYGNALLELGRMESGVLGNALEGVPEGAATDTDEENDDKNEDKTVENANKLKETERKKVINDVKEALETNYKQCMEKQGSKVDGAAAPKANRVAAPKPTGEATPQTNGADVSKTNGVGGEQKETKGDDKMDDGETPDKDGEKDATTGKDKPKKEVKDVCAGTTDMDEGVEEGDSEDEETGNDTGDETKEENPDDVPNFQLAWEMLELSRVIFSRNAKENMLKVAQVHFKLGELGLETEQYAQSLEDFSKCLEIQKANLEPKSRLIAGSHYNLGLAYTLDNKFDKAMEHFTEAKKTIEERIVKLEKDITEEEKEKGDDFEEKVKKMKQEIAELKELVPDILAKIEDAKDSKTQLPAGETTTGFDAPGTTSAAPAQTVQVKRKSDTAPVSDITHLVKRKRAEETNGTDVDGDKAGTKRTKQDGAGDANHVNGTEAPKGEVTDGTAMET